MNTSRNRSRPDEGPLDGLLIEDDDGFSTAWAFPPTTASPEDQLAYVAATHIAHGILKAAAMSEPAPAVPVIKDSERISDSTWAHHMTNDTIMFGCSWPGCNYTSENRDSIPTHYKTHVGQAAQRRRAQRRPRSAEITNDVVEAALASLDMVQLLVDRVDAFEAEHMALVRELDEAKVTIEELRQEDEELRRKAASYDRIQQAIRDATA